MLYFLHSTPVLSLYIDVVLALSILMDFEWICVICLPIICRVVTWVLGQYFYCTGVSQVILMQVNLTVLKYHKGCIVSMFVGTYCVLFINPLTAGRCISIFNNLIFKWQFYPPCLQSLLWNFTGDVNNFKSTLADVMDLCRETTSHYVSYSSLWFMSPYGVTGLNQDFNKMARITWTLVNAFLWIYEFCF